MGFSTGADERDGKAAAAPAAGMRLPTGTGALWAFLGVGATAVLVWLSVDMGGPDRVVAALFEPGTSRSGVALLRAELRTALAGTEAGRPGSDPMTIAENEALRRRVAMLEDMLTGVEGLPAKTSVAQIPAFGASDPGGTRFEPRMADLPLAKGDLPPKGEERAPTAPRGAAEGNIGAPETVAALPATPAAGAERSRLAPAIHFALDLGAYESLEVMRDRWNLIEARHRDILGDLVPRHVAEFGADGRVAHRLIVAPVAGAMAAAELCAALHARAVPCRQTVSAGEPL